MLFTHYVTEINFIIIILQKNYKNLKTQLLHVCNLSKKYHLRLIKVVQGAKGSHLTHMFWIFTADLNTLMYF
jgi:hypothetical protein